MLRQPRTATQLKNVRRENQAGKKGEVLQCLPVNFLPIGVLAAIVYFLSR